MYQLTKKRNVIWKFLGFLVVCSITIEVFKVALSSPPINEQIMETVKEINKHCPIMVDSSTRFENSIAAPNNTLQFNYTLIKNDRAEIDTAIFVKELHTSYVNSITTNPKFKSFKDKGISISATFYDSSAKYVCNVFIDSKQLGQ